MLKFLVVSGAIIGFIWWKMSKPPSKLDIMIKERNHLQHEAEYMVEEDLLCTRTERKLLFTYIERIKTLNTLIDKERGLLSGDKICNICQINSAVLYSSDTIGSYHICVKCIHDVLMEHTAKKQWEQDKN